MPGVCVVGIQWGDEGKGKIVDWLAENADAVVRFQGGHNAGHTTVIGDKKYTYNLLPAGILRGKLSVIGNGVVISPSTLSNEIDRFSALDLPVNPEILKISNRAPMVLSLHSELDRIREQSIDAPPPIGTTLKGIGPAYEDKVARRAIRIGDWLSPTDLRAKIERLLHHHNPLRKGFGLAPLDIDVLLEEVCQYRDRLLPYVEDTSSVVLDLLASGKTVLFEGAQGSLLDVDHGTYPYVTSSNTLSGQVTSGAGIPPTAVNSVIGVAKTYATRVGEGPFPTEVNDGDGDRFRKYGQEFGTVTGRERRCGWFDGVAARHTARLNGISQLILTKIDVLDNFQTLKIGVNYQSASQDHVGFPSTWSTEDSSITPEYVTLPGWHRSTSGIRTWDQLPEEAQAYIRFIEQYLDVPIVAVSTGPERQNTIRRTALLQ